MDKRRILVGEMAGADLFWHWSWAIMTVDDFTWHLNTSVWKKFLLEVVIHIVRF
jgi:hypothetical protein